MNTDVTAINNWVFKLATERTQDVYGCVKQLDDMDQRDLFLDILTNPLQLNVTWNQAAVASLKGRLETIGKNPVYLLPGSKSFWIRLLKGIQNIFGRTSSEKLEQAIYRRAGHSLDTALTVFFQGPNSTRFTGTSPSADELENYAKIFNQFNLISRECKDLADRCNCQREQMKNQLRAYYNISWLRQLPQAKFSANEMSPEIFQFIRSHPDS